MAHYLYVLQTVRLNHLETRMRTPLDSYNQVYFNSLSSFDFWVAQRIFISHTLISLVSCRSRETCFTGSGRPRLRWKARAVWVTNVDVLSAQKSLRNSASLWVRQKNVLVWILHHNKPQSLNSSVFVCTRITVILVRTWAGVLRVSWRWTPWRILPPVTLMLTAGWVSPIGYCYLMQKNSFWSHWMPLY